MTPFTHSKPACIEPGSWPDADGRPRVLVEIPDAAELAAHSDVLAGAGYEVAACSGPTEADSETGQDQTLCPLVVGAQCPLVDGADVVVSTTSLVDAGDIIEHHASTGRVLVVEGAAHALERNRALLRDAGATIVVEPVTPKRLLAAVERACRVQA